MPGGRPPKPTALKVLQGNPGKRALPKNEPKPPAGEVKPPSWLRGPARRHWRAIAPLLAEMGVLTTADQTALSLLCDALAEYVEARAAVTEQGSTYETVRVVGTRLNDEGIEEPITSTMVRQRPEVAIASDAYRRASSMLVQFGLTPSARTKVRVAKPDDVDEFEEFLSGRSRTA